MCIFSAELLAKIFGILKVVSTAKPKVMFIINSLTGGGAEKVLITLLSHSGPWLEKFEISLTLLDIEEVKFAPPAWVPVHQLNCRSGTASAIMQLRRLLSREKPDLILSFLTRANVATQLAIRLNRRAHIISQRANATAQLGSGVRAAVTKLLVRATYPGADRVIAVSDGVADDLTENYGVRSESVVVIPNPVDTRRIMRAAAQGSALAIDGPYVVGVGRLVPLKNFDMLIRAFANSGLPGSLVIIGEGPEKLRLRRVAQQLGLRGRVTLPGFIPNPYPIIRQSNIFALSSNAEGFPNALVEALTLGVPVVATNCRDGPAEILADQSPEAVGAMHLGVGIVVPVGDVDAFARGLRLAAEEPLRTKLSNAGPARIKTYAPEKIVQRYWAVIEDVLLTSQKKLTA